MSSVPNPSSYPRMARPATNIRQSETPVTMSAFMSGILLTSRKAARHLRFMP